jgi:Bifunctional DNA primase/polymerase, N-terminal
MLTTTPETTLPQTPPMEPCAYEYVSNVVAAEPSPERIEAVIDATLRYLDRGWQIYLTPWTGDKPTRWLPTVDCDTGEPLKLWNQGTDPAEVRQAFSDLKTEDYDYQDDALVALATGRQSGVMVIRLHATSINLFAFEQLAVANGQSSPDVTCSGDGYFNYFFKWLANIKHVPEDIWPKIKSRLIAVLEERQRTKFAANDSTGPREKYEIEAIEVLRAGEIEAIEVLGDGDKVLLPPTIGSWCGKENEALDDIPTWLLVELQLMESLPEIQIPADGLSEVATLGERALKKSGKPIYQRSKTLVFPIVSEVEASHKRRTKIAQLEKIEAPYLRDQLRQVANWFRWNKGEQKWVSCNPLYETAVTILWRKDRWTFPAIAGVITTQTMRPDGTLLLEPGFDPATRLLLVDPPPLPPIPERPTRADAEKALKLFEDLLREFKFIDDGGVSYAVALSALITPVVRGAFDVAPMHVARGASSGKSYLFDVVAAIAIGQRAMPVLSAGSTEEELEKRLGAALLSGQPLVSIDNVNGELKGSYLCQVIERPIVETRILGKSELVRIETKGTTLFCTGNNVTIVGDLTRRTITTSLDPKMAQPELRKFEFNPVAKVLANRGAYIAAALTICRAYAVAFESGGLTKADALASFQGWSDTVRSALIWLGKADLVASMEIARDNDPELNAVRDMLTAWSRTFGADKKYAVTLTNVIAKITKREKANSTYDYHESGGPPPLLYPELNDAIQAAAGKPRSPADALSLGTWLRDHKGRVVNVDGFDLRFCSESRAGGGAAKWWVECTTGQTFEPADAGGADDPGAGAGDAADAGGDPWPDPPQPKADDYHD